VSSDLSDDHVANLSEDANVAEYRDDIEMCWHEPAYSKYVAWLCCQLWTLIQGISIRIGHVNNIMQLTLDPTMQPLPCNPKHFAETHVANMEDAF
jgi:hypothetical protein